MSILNNQHTACLGCAQIVAARLAIDQLGPNTIIVNATGCLEVTTTNYPNSAWQIPWLHSTFANAAPVGSGIAAALDYLEKNSQLKNKRPTVLVQGGDGATFDIGFGALTASWARGDDLLYICYDNEGYANTGMQASLATPGQAKTPTSLGEHNSKRNMLAIALAHQVPYIAQANIAFPEDFKKKIAEAQTIKGPRYIQVLVPCLPGWKIKASDQIKAARLASESGLYPLLEFVNGQLKKAEQLPTPTPKVKDYIELQGRYSHLLKNKKALKSLQDLADANIVKFNLLSQ
ncbi:pyruvate ferredoxin oxidoreductase [Candidatus Falkowbacteria bacterium]|nr:pyruvate ferredoxin oxidoreductase [Candidatus Falkowbacteria bacterium]